MKVSCAPDFSVINMRIPSFTAPNKYSWPPAAAPITPEMVMPVLPSHPGANWWAENASKRAEAEAENRRTAA